MYKRNRTGPNIVPCGTPCFMFIHSDLVSFTCTRCILLVKKFSSNSIACAEKPTSVSLDFSIECDIESNALDRSSAAHATKLLLSSSTRIESVRKTSASLVLLAFRKPNCWSIRMC